LWATLPTLAEQRRTAVVRFANHSRPMGRPWRTSLCNSTEERRSRFPACR
jgi:hypothetical protein